MPKAKHKTRRGSTARRGGNIPRATKRPAVHPEKNYKVNLKDGSALTYTGAGLRAKMPYLRHRIANIREL